MAVEEPNEDKDSKKKKVSDDVIKFVMKRSEHDAPQYTAKLKKYVIIQGKRSRANTARRHAEERAAAAANPAARQRYQHDRDPNENPDHGGSDDGRMKRRDHGSVRGRSPSGSVSEPSDRCGRRRRRRRRRKKRCGRRRSRRRRRRRRRRSRRRRSCRRRRRRRRRSSSCRRRRRRSCRRKRRKRRRRC